MLRIAITTLLLSLPTSLTAATSLLDWGVETFDASTNLAWLDLTETNGLSPDAAAATFTNYRNATITEVATLFASAGMPSPLRTNLVSQTAAQDFIALLGATTNPTTTQAWALGTGGVNYTDPGVVSNLIGIGPRTYRGNSDNGWVSSTTALPGLGVFMVRDATPAAAPVPLPAGFVLMITGLAGLGVYSRKQSKA